MRLSGPCHCCIDVKEWRGLHCVRLAGWFSQKIPRFQPGVLFECGIHGENTIVYRCFFFIDDLVKRNSFGHAFENSSQELIAVVLLFFQHDGILSPHHRPESKQEKRDTGSLIRVHAFSRNGLNSLTSLPLYLKPASTPHFSHDDVLVGLKVFDF